MTLRLPLPQPPLTALLGLSPALARHISSELVLQRLNYTTGRTLTESAIELEQAWAEGRLGAAGRRMSAGIVDGLVIGVADQTAAPGEFTISAGRGITPGGQDVAVLRPATLNLADLPQLGTAGGAAGDAEGLVALALEPIVVEAERLPVDATRTFAFEDPCPPDATTAPYLDFVLQDAARIGWLPLDSALMGTEPAFAPNVAAEAIRQIEADDPALLPWAAFGLPLALVLVEPDGRIAWVHRAAVARRGGMLPVAGITRLARLRQSRVEGLIEEAARASAADRWDGRGGYTFLRHLPPAGLLPRKAWDGGDFFPPTWGQAQAPIPISQLDAALEAARALAPYNTSAVRDRVKWLVPVPDALYAPDLLEPVTDPDFDVLRIPLQARVADTLVLRNAYRSQALAVQGAIELSAVTDFAEAEDDPIAGEEGFDTDAPESPETFDEKATAALQAVHDRLDATLFTDPQRSMVDPSRLTQANLEAGATVGLTSFVTAMRALIDASNDTVDFAFNRVQAEIYRLRQIMLDDEESTKLATFPVLAGLAKGSNDYALSQGLRAHFLTRPSPSAEPGIVAAPPPDGGGGPLGGLALPILAIDRGVFSITPTVRPEASRGAVTSVGGARLSPAALGMTALTGFGDKSASFTFGAFLGTGEAAAPANATLVKDLVDNTRAGFVDDVILSDAQAKRTGILRATPLPGDIRDARSTTIADRLKTSAALNAKASAVRIKADVLRQIQELGISLVGLQVPLASARDRAFLLSEDVDATIEATLTAAERDQFADQIARLRVRADTSDDRRDWELVRLPGAAAGAEGQVTPLTRLGDALRRRKAPVDMTLLPAFTLSKQLDPDPEAGRSPDGEGDDESAYLASAVMTLESAVQILRVVEARICAISAVVDEVAATLKVLSDIDSRWSSALSLADQDLDEARHDLRVALSLIDEEMARLDALRAHRQRVIDEEVKFVAYTRPRALMPHAEGDTLGLRLPGTFEDPLPASLREDVDLPDDLQEMVGALREMPIGWFASNPELAEEFKSPKFLDRVYSGVIARARTKYAKLQSEPVYSVQPSRGTGRAVTLSRQIATGYRGTMLNLLSARASLDVAALSRASWADRRRRALADLSLNDLIEAGTHPRVARRAADEIEQIERVVHAEMQLARQIPPAIRLLWAQELSAYDTVASLRSLTRLPLWSQVDWSLRKRLERLNGWLFSRMEQQVSEANALMTDIVRVAILLAAHAPVADIIAARLDVDQTVSTGGAIDLVVRRGLPAIGMQVAVFSGSNVAARGIVRDLSGAKAKVEVTYLQQGLVTLTPANQVAVFAPGARAKIGR